MTFAATTTAAAAAAVASAIEPLAARPEPVVNISVIRPREGQYEAFLELQLAQHRRLRGQVKGLRGARLFRSEQGLVLISVFDTEEDAEAFRRDPRLTDHLARVRPLIERSEAGVFSEAYAVGAI
ncbi:MAG: antibiotic biosynthesis monooxygenase [Caulobacter sp.]